MGQGRNAVFLAQQGWDVTGFDPSEEAVRIANRNAASVGVKIGTARRSIESSG
jgi:2-polyprenyl-3-methyl-5-hydroxy-6-metoxy-1,4-benzoquinol methylase